MKQRAIVSVVITAGNNIHTSVDEKIVRSLQLNLVLIIIYEKTFFNW